MVNDWKNDGILETAENETVCLLLQGVSLCIYLFKKFEIVLYVSFLT